MMETNDFYRGLIQGMVGEQGFPRDPIAAEDEVFYRLGELVEENAISDKEAMECWQQYIQQVRPYFRVIHLGQTVSKPFYE